MAHDPISKYQDAEQTETLAVYYEQKQKDQMVIIPLRIEKARHKDSRLQSQCSGGREGQSSMIFEVSLLYIESSRPVRSHHKEANKQIFGRRKVQMAEKLERLGMEGGRNRN